MKILIVGAGIGGLSAAAFLNDSKIDYEIVEKAPSWEHQGYALGLWNNGRNIFKKLGLAEEFDKKGKRIHAYHIYTGKGKLLRKYNFRDFYANYGLALTLIERSQIHDWLISKVSNEKIKMGVDVQLIKQDGKGVEVGFSNGHTGIYDLVIGADGIHSRIRGLIFGEHIESKSEWRVWWMWVDNKFKKEASVNEYLEPGEFMSTFDAGEKTLAVIVAPKNNIVWDSPENRIARLKILFKDETALVPEIFDTLRTEDITPTDLTHVSLKKWVQGRVVLLGDAAHGLEPFGGIGGSMALEDGYILAGELMRVSNEYVLDAALRNYETARQGRFQVARKVTNKMKGWVLIRSRILRGIVNFFIPFFPEKYFIKDYQDLLQEEI